MAAIGCRINLAALQNQERSDCNAIPIILVGGSRYAPGSVTSSYVQHGIWNAIPIILAGGSRCAPGSATFELRATRNLGGTAA